MNKNIWIVAGVLVLIVLGWFLFQNNYANGPTTGDETENIKEAGNGGDEATEETSDGGDETTGDEVANEVPVEEGVDEMVVEDDGGEVLSDTSTISFDGTSYSPSAITVEAGTTVAFENNSDKRMWPASAIHPTHTLYPESSIAKCGTDEADSIFDACGSVNSGESYSFTFDEVGEWKYHDHLRPSANGTIVVTSVE